MPTTVTILYPQGGKFNMDYYLSSHMPLVGKGWKSYGLTSWTVLEFPSEAQFTVQATLEFESLESFQKAGAGSEAQEIFGDIKNFSDKDPVILVGEVKGTS